MKQIKGFVSEILLEAFSEGRIEDVTLFRESIEGIGFPVTLSPVGQEESQEPDYGWVRVQAVKSETCIICHKKLLEHNIPDLGECRRDLYRKYLKVAKGLREIHAHLEVGFLGLEAKHTPPCAVRRMAPQTEPDEGCDLKPEEK